MPLTTLAAVKTRLGIATVDATRDAALTALVASVSRDAERFCRRLFTYAAAVTEYRDGGGAVELGLRLPPVHSIASVHVSSATPRVYDATTVLEAGTDYDFETDDRPPYATTLYLLTCGRVFPVGRKSVKIVYAGGFGQSAPTGFQSIPEDVEQAVIEIISAKYHKGVGGEYHLTSVTAIDGNVGGIRFDDWPERARECLEQYQLVGVA